MRLPWPFGRTQRSPSDGAPAPSGGAVVAERGADDAWRHLPALAETIGPPPLMAPVAPFAASLAADNPPPPILAPLTHGRGLEAPSGIAVGVARPVASERGPGTPAPVQRSPLRPRPAAEGGSALFDDAPAREPDVAAPPIRHLAVASDVAPMPARSLVASGATGTARPAPGLVLPPRAPGQATGADGFRVQRSPAAPAAEPPVGLPPAPSAPEPTAAAEVAPPVAGRRNLGQTRRLGLGAPISGIPAPAAAAVPSPLPPPAPAMTLVQRAPAADPSVPLEPEAAGEVERGPASGAEPARPDPGASRLTLALRAPDPVGEPPPDIAPSLPAVSAVIAEPAATQGPLRPAGARPGSRPGRGSNAPLVSARPLRAAVQRSSLAMAAPGGDPATGVPREKAALASAGDGPVKIHRDQAAGDMSRSINARSFTHGGEIFLPSSHGPLTSGTGRSLLAHELTHVTQQRRMGASLPDETSPHGQRLEAEAVAAERSGTLPLASSHAGHDHGEPGSSARRGADSAPAGATPQRAGLPGTAPEPEVAATGTTTIDFSAVQRAPMESEPPKGPTTTGGHAYSEPELENLAHQLYGRIGRMLRRELLVDRERAGLAMDIR